MRRVLRNDGGFHRPRPEDRYCIHACSEPDANAGPGPDWGARSQERRVHEGILSVSSGEGSRNESALWRNSRRAELGSSVVAMIQQIVDLRKQFDMLLYLVTRC